MRIRLLAAAFTFAALTSSAATPARAQLSDCTPFSGSSRRVCDAAVDGTRAFHPVAGLLVSGGNPVIGTANTLGGLGGFSITARANAAHVPLPDPEYDGASSSAVATEELYAPVPLLEGAAGIYGGLPSGLLSVDFLASAHLLPTNQIDHLSVEDGARRIGDVALGLGYGVRVGILRENGPLPAVSVSAMRRSIPRVTYGDLDEGDEFRYAVDLQATNLRLVAGKQFAALQVAAGVGWDRYTGDAEIRLADQPLALELDLKESRTLAFLNVGLDITAVTLVGEAGYQSGSDRELSTDFEDFDTRDGKFFAGLGLRLSL